MKSRLFVLVMMISITVLFAACSSNNEVIQTSVNVKEGPKLYPAFIMEGSEKKWGFINEEGKFVIEPRYESASDFRSNGMAEVTENGSSMVIDESGKQIMAAPYLYTYNYNRQAVVVSDDSGKSYLMDGSGKILFQTEGWIGELSNGMAYYSKKIDDNKSLFGYIDESGQVVIEAKYEWGQALSKDKALVQIGEGHYGIIDRNGKLLNEIFKDRIVSLSEDILIFSEMDSNNNQKYGFMTLDGQIMLDAIYSEAQGIADGLTVVNTAKDFGNEFGVMNQKGEFIIPPKYPSITYLGNGIFAVPKPQDVYFNPIYTQKALFDKTGKQLTDFIYYDLEPLKDGLISATDDKNTYLIDIKDTELKEIMRAEGVGSIKPMGSLYKVEADNTLYYLSEEGNKVWSSNNTIQLEGGLTVEMQTFRPDRCMLIQYPEIKGLSDIKVQEKINALLKDLFVGDTKGSSKDGDVYTETNDVAYTVYKNKDLLVVSKDGYYYPIGAAHGQPIREDYHIDMKNGNLYALKDLFKQDSDYKGKLEEIILRMIDKINEEHGELVYSGDIGEFEEYSGFMIQKDSLKIYFYPYAIASYAAGFPEFEISYDELADLIDTNEGLWNSFDREPYGTQNKAVNEVYPEEKAKIEEAMKNYEDSMIEAINSNDFNLVRPWLYPNSSLYNAQEKLIEDLNQKQIKERLDSYTIENIEPDALGTIYRVYVTENIGIQYPGQDYTTKQFNWIYSLRYDYETKHFQLTYISKWEKK